MKLNFDLKRHELVINFFSIILAIFLGSLFFINIDIIKIIAEEDNLLEWTSTICYFLACILFIWRNKQDNFRNIWYWFFSALTFVIAGEEISWGQRIFNIQTPDNLKTINVQGEFNIHNIDGIYQHIKLIGVLIFLLCFYAIPISIYVNQKMFKLCQKIKFPIFPIFLLLIPTISLVYMTIPRVAKLWMEVSDKMAYYLDEVGEFYLGITFLLFAIYHIVLDSVQDKNEKRSGQARQE